VVLVCQQTLARLSRKHTFIVRVVPGEADDFCVRLAREQENAYIVSVDGDFLIHVGETGNFIPLQTFPMRWDNTLSLSVYTKLRQGLGITRPNGMVEVAALLIDHGQMTVPQCIKCVNQQKTLDFISRDALRGYIAAYTAMEELSTSRHAQDYFESGNVSGRTTELLSGGDEPTHWLPLLPVSNPPRKDPWIVSRSIRQTAYYTLQRRGLLHGANVIEMVRRGQRIVQEIVSIEDTGLKTKMDREDVFITAMRILIENTSDDEMRSLPLFCGMFSLLGQSCTRLSSAAIPPPLHYLALQYQSLIYSLIILLQCQSPTSADIPEFASLWDLPHFKTALSTKTEWRDIWIKVTEEMQPSLQNLWDTRNCAPSSAKTKHKQPKSTESKDAITTKTTFDAGNPFSILSANNS
jgi:hypothetical protein